MSTFSGSSCTPSKRRSRVRDRWPSAMATTSKSRSSPEANRTVAWVSPASTVSIRSPKRYSAPALRSWRRLRQLAAEDLQLGGRAVVAVLVEGRRGLAVGVDELRAGLGRVAGRIASSIPSRRAASRPAPRTSTFWPSSRSRSSRSTTVTSHRRRRASRRVRGRRYPRRRSGCGGPWPAPTHGAARPSQRRLSKISRRSSTVVSGFTTASRAHGRPRWRVGTRKPTWRRSRSALQRA